MPDRNRDPDDDLIRRSPDQETDLHLLRAMHTKVAAQHDTRIGMIESAVFGPPGGTGIGQLEMMRGMRRDLDLLAGKLDAQEARMNARVEAQDERAAALSKQFAAALLAIVAFFGAQLFFAVFTK